MIKKYHNEIEEEKKEDSKDNKKKKQIKKKKHKIARQKNLSTTKDSSLNSQNINEENGKEINPQLNIKDLFSAIFTNNRVYIGNINYKITEDELKSFSANVGKWLITKLEGVIKVWVPIIKRPVRVFVQDASWDVLGQCLGPIRAKEVFFNRDPKGWKFWKFS